MVAFVATIGRYEAFYINIPISGSSTSSLYDPYDRGMENLSANSFAESRLLPATAATWRKIISNVLVC